LVSTLAEMIAVVSIFGLLVVIAIPDSIEWALKQRKQNTGTPG
jgi:Tfp pilus assembly protein FimT